ncbi:MAG: TonB system transport protein ExbD [Immundisolibacteraceae bacterium]|nr:TonB system transport protein ExbD [Immundisolibacteraceae bacterium]
MLLNSDQDELDLAESHEINVTPFIDVMLVLLIIFMVAAPLATVDLPVDLPAVSAANQLDENQPVTVTLKKNRSIAVGDQLVQIDNLAALLNQATQQDVNQRIFLRADRQVAYGELMALMDRLRAAGYMKIALVGLESLDQ